MSGMDGARASRRSNAARKGATASARRLRCPACERKAALGAKAEWPDGWARKCRYCGHEVGMTLGESFGRDEQSIARTRAKTHRADS